MAMLVTGARQVGKTTLLRHLGETGDLKFNFVTLDDPTACELALRDPALFLQRHPEPVIIDEIQLCPSLLPHIKMEIDESANVNRKSKFWLSGSQQFHVMRGVSESLAGRVGIVNLYGLSISEIVGEPYNAPFVPSKELWGARARFSLDELYSRIWRGSFPGAALSDVDKELFYYSYTQTYIERDVRALSQVGDESAFLRFLRAAAARTAQILNISSLARDADIAPNTAKSWLSILTTSGIVYLLEPFHTNLTKRLVKAPKLYFTDTGLCTWLCGWESAKTLEAGAMSGAILETFALVELLKSYLHNAKSPRFFYYRDKDQVEIDLLIERDGVLHPVEIKKTASPKRDVVEKSVSKLGKLGLPVGDGAFLCLIPEAAPLSEKLTAVPISAL